MCWTLAILGNYQLTLLVPIPDEEKKIKLNFYFHTPLFWCLKRFYQGLKGLYKTFWGTTKKCDNKNLTLIFIWIQLSEMHGTLKVKIFKSLKNVDWVVNWGPIITPVVLSSSIFLQLPRKLFLWWKSVCYCLGPIAGGAVDSTCVSLLLRIVSLHRMGET